MTPTNKMSYGKLFTRVGRLNVAVGTSLLLSYAEPALNEGVWVHLSDKFWDYVPSAIKALHNGPQRSYLSSQNCNKKDIPPAQNPSVSQSLRIHDLIDEIINNYSICQVILKFRILRPQLINQIFLVSEPRNYLPIGTCGSLIREYLDNFITSIF